MYASPNIVRVFNVKEYEMDRACNTRGRVEKCIQNFGQNT
jgi:hypothetical protein